MIKGIAFITTPVFTRLLTPSEFGILNLFLSYEAILAMLMGFQFAASIKSANILFSQNGNTLIEYARTVVLLVFGHSLFVLIITNVFNSQVLALTGIANRLMINLLVLISCGNAILTVYNSYVSISYSYKKYVAIAMINAVSNIVISLVLILTLMRSKAAFGRILGYVIPYIMVSIYVVYVFFRGQKKTCIVQRKYLKFAYRYSTPLLPHGFAEVMLGQFGKLTVNNNLGKSSMGIYSLSYNVYSIIGIIRIAMDYVFGPFFFDKRKTGDITTLRRTISAYSRSLAIVSIGIMLLSSEIVRILGSPEYFDARFTAIPLVCASYFVFIISVISQEEYYSQRTHLVSIASVITMGLNIVLNLALVPMYGSLGAAIATAISYLIMIWIHAYIVIHVLVSKTFDWRSIVLDCAFVLVMAFISFIVVDMVIIRFCCLTVMAGLGLFQFHSLLQIVNKKRN